MKRICVITPCYNEEGNVKLLAERVAAVFRELPGYAYEHLFADNASTDATLDVLRTLAAADAHIKVIANAKNFGQPRSLFNAILAAEADAIVIVAADLQDPPELIPRFIQKWEEGFQVVFGIRAKRHEAPLMTLARKGYYRALHRISGDNLVMDAGDFLLMDQRVQEILRRIRDTNPYLRGLLVSLGFSCTGIDYTMEARHSGKTKLSPFGLMAFAWNGVINHTLLPLRLATAVGLGMSLLSILAAFGYLVLKLISWQTSPPGIATLIIGMFFLAGVQLFLLGFIGELVASIFREGKNFPLVVERERVNFGPEPESRK